MRYVMEQFHETKRARASTGNLKLDWILSSRRCSTSNSSITQNFMQRVAFPGPDISHTRGRKSLVSLYQIECGRSENSCVVESRLSLVADKCCSDA